MGLLDNKTRVIDAIITSEGRRQIADGDLRIKYVSFSDVGTFYQADVASGSSDVSSRIYLEANSLPQDQVTFESNDAGNLRPFKNAKNIDISDGKIVVRSFNSLTSSLVTGSLVNSTTLSSLEFASTSRELLQSSIENFANLRIIGSINSVFEEDGFGVGPSELEFIITPERPIRDRNEHIAHVDSLESLFNDPRLSRVKNFAYLPPINRVDDESIDKKDPALTSNFRLGAYPPWGRVERLSYEQLRHELDYYDDLGFSKTITFDPTTNNNRLVAQFFEQGYDTLKKLDVIDFGQHVTGETGDLVHVFFAGKLVVDDNGTHSFVHMFTLVFE